MQENAAFSQGMASYLNFGPLTDRQKLMLWAHGGVHKARCIKNVHNLNTYDHWSCWSQDKKTPWVTRPQL